MANGKWHEISVAVPRSLAMGPLWSADALFVSYGRVPRLKVDI